jgi:hypothetical protein
VDAAAGTTLASRSPLRPSPTQNAGVRRHPQEDPAMTNNRPEPNTELRESFEPLRTAFAVLALLLGFVAALHF